MERGIGPDATVTLDFALARLAGMIDKLTIYPERMLANLESLGGVVHSGEVLLALTRAGISREDAYAIVQRHAMATWNTLGQPGAADFRAQLLADPAVAAHVTARADRRGDGRQPPPHPDRRAVRSYLRLMCTVVLRSGADGVFIGANRDEMIGRPWTPAGGALAGAAGGDRRARHAGRRHLARQSTLTAWWRRC